jgi:hypothetical protein
MNLVRQTFCTVAVLLAAIGACVGQVPKTYFGMNIHSSYAEPGGARKQWPAGWIGAIRLWDTGTGWNAINPSSGKYEWYKLDKWLGIAEAHGVDVLYTFGRTPQWASANPDRECNYGPGQCAAPKDMNAWDEFVRAIATHAKGRIKYWEIWNEANDTAYWAGTVPQLVTMAEHASRIIKSIDPKAIILTPSATGGDTWGSSWLDIYLREGGGKAADVIAFHGYWGDDPMKMLALVANYRQVMAKNGQAHKPLWNTEGGWGRNDKLANAELQVAYLAQYYLLQWSSGVARVYWYAWGNEEWGTIADAHGITPAGIAYRELSGWLVGAQVSSPCTQNGPIWTCSLTRPNGYKATIAWSLRPMRWTPPPGVREYRDLSGDLAGVASQQVNLDARPILLESEIGNSAESRASNVSH